MSKATQQPTQTAISSAITEQTNAQATGSTSNQENTAANATATPPAAPQQENVTLTQQSAPAPQNVTSAVKQAPAAPVVEAKKTVQAGVVVKSTAPVEDGQLAEVVEAMKIGKMQTQSALTQLLEYVRDMHPGQSQTAATIEANQIKLFNSLFVILISEDVNFSKVFKAVIALVKKHRNDAFKVTMRNRGLNSISLSSMDNKSMRFLTRVVDLLHVASGLNDISKVKEHVDMNKLLDAVTNVRAKQNLTAFFS
jgi:hypothetical protein